MNLGRRKSLSNPGLSVTPEYDHGKTLKKAILMNHSWSTHEPLIKGPLGIQIHSCIHTFRMKKAIFGILRIPTDSFGLLRISRWTFWRIPDPWLSCRVCLSPTVLRGWSKDIHQSKLLCGTYSWKTHGPLMNHSWRGGILEIPQDPTHEPLIKGWLYILIHSFSMNPKDLFLILGIPKGSFGPLRISRWTSWRIPDPWLSWMICLSITDLRGLFKDVHQSKFFVAPTHEKLMTHSWTTHEWAELLNTHRQIKVMTPTAR